MSTTTTSGFWETSSCGLDLRFPCPKTANEFDRAAGFVGAAHHYAVQCIGLHDTLPEWQEALAKRLVEEFNFPRKIDDKATEKKRQYVVKQDKCTPVYEAVKKYVARLMVSLDKEGQARVKAIAQSVAEANPVDPSPAARRGAIMAENLRMAESLLSAPADHYESKISLYSDYIGGYIVERNGGNAPTTESLARLIQTYRKRRDDEDKAELAMAD